ncbi:unnamed protein product [Prorocentrum cordatum]|uniref:Uncharacterized protein n=1 Tax=Prorocentrum cordatum TaxID=2364126 RepID=A0ABN9YFA1_9DINO|nr:unnamed protein product [Polarella glacialis]
MRPALDAFERGMAGAAAEWHAAASEVDRVLLSEWEARQCEEMFHLCERVYSPAEAALRDTVATGYVSSDVVRAIRAVACQRSDWRGHPVACDRSASVLIACLSTALRATRCHARVVLAPQVQEPPAALGRAGLQRALAACSGAEPEPEPGLSRRLAAAANEAAELALICREAKAADGSSSPMSTPSGVLGSFAAAFEEAAAALCDGLARQFAGTHRHALRAASAAAWPACGHGARAAAPPQTPRGQERSALEGPCAAATRFLEETLDGGPALAARLACEALLRLLVRRWARRFCRGARRPAGVAAVLAQVAADEGALDRLAATWGVAARRASGGSDPVRPLREVCGILAAPQPDAEARAGAGRMEELLGVQQATNLAAAAAAVCSAAACPAGHRRGRRRAASAGAATGSPGRAAELPDAV